MPSGDDESSNMNTNQADLQSLYFAPEENYDNEPSLFRIAHEIVQNVIERAHFEIALEAREDDFEADDKPTEKRLNQAVSIEETFGEVLGAQIEVEHATDKLECGDMLHSESENPQSTCLLGDTNATKSSRNDEGNDNHTTASQLSHDAVRLQLTPVITVTSPNGISEVIYPRALATTMSDSARAQADSYAANASQDNQNTETSQNLLTGDDTLSSLLIAKVTSKSFCSSEVAENPSESTEAWGKDVFPKDGESEKGASRGLTTSPVLNAISHSEEDFLLAEAEAAFFAEFEDSGAGEISSLAVDVVEESVRGKAGDAEYQPTSGKEGSESNHLPCSGNIYREVSSQTDYVDSDFKIRDHETIIAGDTTAKAEDKGEGAIAAPTRKAKPITAGNYLSKK